MISHSHRCISIHIPKSAGNSVNRAFGVDWQDHKDIARHRAELPADVFNSYFKFAVVRNPWDRLLSDYNYQLRKSRPAESKLHLYDERGTRRSFAQWVEAVLAQSHPYPASSWGGDVSPGIHRFSPQLDWITIDGIQAVDYVARFESLDDDFRVVWRGGAGMLALTPPQPTVSFSLLAVLRLVDPRCSRAILRPRYRGIQLRVRGPKDSVPLVRL